MGKDSVRSISNKVIKYDKQEVAPGKQNASAACPEDKLELNIFPTPALTWKYQSVEKPEFQTGTSGCFYSLSNVWIDQLLIPSSCCFWQELKEAFRMWLWAIHNLIIIFITHNLCFHNFVLLSVTLLK